MRILEVKQQSQKNEVATNPRATRSYFHAAFRGTFFLPLWHRNHEVQLSPLRLSYNGGLSIYFFRCGIPVDRIKLSAFEVTHILAILAHRTTWEGSAVTMSTNLSMLRRGPFICYNISCYLLLKHKAPLAARIITRTRKIIWKARQARQPAALLFSHLWNMQYWEHLSHLTVPFLVVFLHSEPIFAGVRWWPTKANIKLVAHHDSCLRDNLILRGSPTAIRQTRWSSLVSPNFAGDRILPLKTRDDDTKHGRVNPEQNISPLDSA